MKVLIRQAGIISMTFTVLTVPLLIGCDLTEEEDLGGLSGSWQATDLSVDGTSVMPRLNAEYDRLVLTLRRGAEGEELFSFVGSREDTGSDLTAEGTFDKDGSELTLFPADTLSIGSIELDYTIVDSAGSTLQLHAEEGESERSFLQLIRLPIQGAVDQVTIRLSKNQDR